MMPVWMHLLGQKLIRAVDHSAIVHIPYAKIVASLFTLIVPLLIGLAIAKKKPNWAIKARKVKKFNFK